tara:strand:- start:3476 stop:4372 length:897 start_codon:yes stop_codon:yes gene_type:complete
MKYVFQTIFIIIICLCLTSCGPKGHKHRGHGHGGKGEYKLLTKNDFQNLGEHSFDLNNGTEDQYESAANLSGSLEEIQKKTEGLWPRMAKGTVYNVSESRLNITENEDFLIFETNNIPKHLLTRTNPNEARPKNYSFYIPKNPNLLEVPYPITKQTQEIGIALNGVVIAGPYDSQDKIAPYNRVVDECSSHADPQGMYHYHFSPLCLKNSKGDAVGVSPLNQIGWSFDGYKIFGLADRKKHMPVIDNCNGHSHDGEYHYHATIDYPFFMGCYKAEPQNSNFEQKQRAGKQYKDKRKRD